MPQADDENIISQSVEAIGGNVISFAEKMQAKVGKAVGRLERAGWSISDDRPEASLSGELEHLSVMLAVLAKQASKHLRAAGDDCTEAFLFRLQARVGGYSKKAEKLERKAAKWKQRAKCC